VEAFKAKHYLSDDDLAALQAITPRLSERSRITAPPTTTFATGCAGKNLPLEGKIHHRLGRCGL
jgi:transketolase N-terminal domain/subunit